MSNVTTYKQKVARTKDLLKAMEPRLMEKAGSMITPKTLVHAAMSAAQRIPELMDCEPASMLVALLQAEAIGLVPDGRNGHLIPYNDKNRGKIVQFQPDYKGLVSLIYQNQQVAKVEAGVVKENDRFEYQRGSDSFLRHTPALKNRGKTIAAWALVRFTNGEETFEILNQEDIEKRKNASQSARSGFSPWNQWPDEMARKSVLKYLSKTVPLGREVERAVEHDSSVEAGTQSPVTIDAEFAEVPQPPTQTENVAAKAKQKRKQTAKKPPQNPPAEPEAADDHEAPEAHTGGPTPFERMRDYVSAARETEDAEDELVSLLKQSEGMKNSGQITAKEFEKLQEMIHAPV